MIEIGVTGRKTRGLKGSGKCRIPETETTRKTNFTRRDLNTYRPRKEISPESNV